MIMRTGKAQGIKTNCIRLWGTLMLLFMLGMMRLPVYGAEEFSVQELSGEGTVTSDSLNIRAVFQYSTDIQAGIPQSAVKL